MIDVIRKSCVGHFYMAFVVLLAQIVASSDSGGLGRTVVRLYMESVWTQLALLPPHQKATSDPEGSRDTRPSL